MSQERWVTINEKPIDKDLLIQLAEQKDKEQLYEILDLNADQLTYYLEETILDNPFIELEYPIEKKVAKINSTTLNQSNFPVELDSPGAPQSLTMFLFEQIMMYRDTPIRQAMILLVDYIDERGYLPYTYQDLAEKLSIDPIVVLDAMTLMKQLEPTGVGAFDLRESMMLQTEQDAKSPEIAYFLLEEYFDLIKRQQIEKLVETSGFDKDEIENCLNYFYSLRPIPAMIFKQEAQDYLIPDISLRLNENEFELLYNRKYYPKIIFNESYYQEMLEQDDAQLQEYVKLQQHNYHRLAKNLKLREQLIVLVVKKLVAAQKQAFKTNRLMMSPYLMRDLARDTELSESLVKLLITNKNLEWNHRVYPMTKFINVTQHKGRGGLNTVNIKAIIAEIIEKNGKDILTSDIMQKLSEQKIIMSETLIEEYRNDLP